MTITRQVTWGEALMVEMSKVPGGLNAVVNAVRDQLGVVAGTRNTFSKLYGVEDPSVLPKRDQFRAWALLAAVGQKPEEWGLTPDCVPPAVPRGLLAESLLAARGALRDQNTVTSDQKVRGSNPFGCTSG